jgi:hypothetical protein
MLNGQRLRKARFGTATTKRLQRLASWDDRGNGTPLQRNRTAGGNIAMADRQLSGTTISQVRFQTECA